MRVAIVSLFVTATFALPELFQRAACNRDNCLRAVVASSASPGNAQGSADCSSFFRRTYTPCPVTSTAIATSTPTFLTVATSTASTTVTSTTVASATITTTTTVTSTNTITSTATVTSTQYPYGAYSNAPFKRDMVLLAQAITDCASVGTASSVPPYASACSGTARYSSACSCDGITPTTTTLIPLTSTVTSTSTLATVTITSSTSTTTQTFTQTETDTTTLTATATATQTTSTATTTTSTYAPTASTCAQGSEFCGPNPGAGNCECYSTENHGNICYVHGGNTDYPACTMDSDCSSGYCLKYVGYCADSGLLAQCQDP